MKTIFALTALLCILSSCKKDYVCKCTDWGTTPSSVTYSTIHDTKENAKANCEDRQGFPESGCVLQ